MRHLKRKKILDRKIGARKALLKILADQLILFETIETTETKAKALKPYIEKIVTRARKPALHNIKLVRSALKTRNAATKLVKLIAPKYLERKGGYTKIIKLKFRKGDGAKIVRMQFV